VAISDGKKFIASAVTDGTIKLWDFNSGEVIKVFKEESGLGCYSACLLTTDT